MASRISLRLSSSIRATHLPQCTRTSALIARSYSTEPKIPPLLLKIRTDLKNAMRAKDTPRLAVLRGLLADITNASKTSTPANTDNAVLALLLKRLSASRAAADEFKAAKRDDLVEKEEKEIAVMEEIKGGVDMVGEEEVRKMVDEVREKLEKEGKKSGKGEVMRGLIGPGGVFEGRAIEAKMVARVVQEVVGAAK